MGMGIGMGGKKTNPVKHRRPIGRATRIAKVRNPSPIIIDPFGFIRVGGVVLGRVFMSRDQQLIEIKDRNKNRSRSRGDRYVYLSLGRLEEVLGE